MHDVVDGHDRDGCGRCRELLPWHAAGSVTGPERDFMVEHLADCPACRSELGGWSFVAQAVVAGGRAISPPVEAAASWERFSASLDVVSGEARASGGMAVIARAGQHFVMVVTAQARVLRRGMWIASALGIVLAALYAVFVPSVNAGDVLTFALPLVAAAGAAFLYGPENDAAMELALGTPTSARAVVFARFCLLFAYDIALALVATAWVAQAHGENLWLLSSLWFGPMALLASVSLALSLFVTPFVAGALAAGFWLARLLRLENGASLRLAPNLLWHTSPQILALALGLLAVALYAMPRPQRPMAE